MQIRFTPMRHDQSLTLAKSGDTLIINDIAFDLSIIPEGATLPQEAVTCDWLASDIERIDGRLHLTLILPHGPDAPQEALFPAAITVEDDGPIVLPTPSEEPQE
ncbi:hypothetical protein ACSSNL_18230 [Thalassobius sp. S69A]|uniref:hypothetical protein n=1 Tax=unclassified Thalassovita TaxID=2619711 RepID=UPI003C7BD40E